MTAAPRCRRCGDYAPTELDTIRALLAGGADPDVEPVVRVTYVACARRHLADLDARIAAARISLAAAETLLSRMGGA